MFSSTVNSGTSRRSSGMYPRPWLARRCAGNASRSTGPGSALPRAGSVPIKARTKADLPSRLRRLSPHSSPSFMAREASRTIGIAPIDTLRLSILSMTGPGLEPHAADEFLHPRIVERLMRGAIGDDRTVIEREDTIGEPHDNFHVVFDEWNRALPCRERRQDALSRAD